MHYNDKVRRAIKKADCADILSRYDSGELTVDDVLNRLDDFIFSMEEHEERSDYRYTVSVADVRNNVETAERVKAVSQTFLTYDEAFSYVGMCMTCDIQEYGRADVYRITCIDGQKHEVCFWLLDNERIFPPCKRPTYCDFGCCGCKMCHADDVPPWLSDPFPDDMPF